MLIHSLPDDLHLKDNAPVQLYDYHNTTEHHKSKVNLNKHTFSFLQEGTKEVLTPQTPIQIQNEAFLIMKSGHCLMTEKLSATNQHYHSVLLFFSNEILLEFFRKHDLRVPKDKPARSIAVVEYDAYINSFVQELIAIKHFNPHFRNKLLQVKMEEILLYLTETQGLDFLLFLLSHTDNHIQNMISIVESNKLNRLTIKELAFLSNMSVSTFKREFEHHFHSSPSKWFRDQRLEHAAFLLRKHASRPSDIFDEIGYENLSNFTQAFKNKFGLTPKQFQMQE